MCLAVPGKLISVTAGAAPGQVDRAGTVDFQGTRVEVGLAFVPEAGVGDWLLVHAGFALSVLDEAEARQTWEYLRELDATEPPAVSAARTTGARTAM
jgi:hydrogenase expression/formation protein HypC